MNSGDEQARIRLDIFAWLEMRQSEQPWISRNDLLNSYSWMGVRIPLISTQKGIWNPARFEETLSILSTARSKYSDAWFENGDILYDYEDTDPVGGANKKLRLAFERQTPLIYFEGVEPSKYVARFPVYVIADNFPARKFTVNLSGARTFQESQLPLEPIQREYAERQILQRVHQPKFRAQVILAYRTQCAICRLQHAELLDAAHIMPDHHERGIAAIHNGLALCKIHHTAYDRNLIGISPGYQVQVDKKLLLEIDGPMLKHGIQEMDGVTIQIPSRSNQQPDRDLLEIRFKEFLAVSR
jgi:putative restriction endonuclease